MGAVAHVTIRSTIPSGIWVILHWTIVLAGRNIHVVYQGTMGKSLSNLEEVALAGWI